MNLRILSLSLLSLAVSSSAETKKPSDRPDILPADAQLEQLWNDGEFTEGVAVAPDGRIYFSDISKSADKPGRILRFDPESKLTTVYCPDSGKSNGLMFDRGGRLIACCGANGGRMALCEVLQSGELKVLADRYQGKRFMAPNDLVIMPDGKIWFTDPRYIGPEPIELDQMCLYRYDPESSSLERMTTEKLIEKPNGVHISPDGKTLYVAETNNGSKGQPGDSATPKPGRMTLNAFPILKNGKLGRKKVLASFGKEVGTDGMTIDVQGNIYAAVRMDSRHGIVVFNPKGKELAYIPTDALPTNCSFGNGKESAMLYITVGTGLYRIQLRIDGYHPAVAAR